MREGRPPAVRDWRDRAPGRAAMVEYVCRDCGGRIFSYTPDPDPILCASCDWIRRNVPVADQAAARERLGVPLAGNADPA